MIAFQRVLLPGTPREQRVIPDKIVYINVNTKTNKNLYQVNELETLPFSKWKLKAHCFSKSLKSMFLGHTFYHTLCNLQKQRHCVKSRN